MNLADHMILPKHGDSFGPLSLRGPPFTFLSHGKMQSSWNKNWIYIHHFFLFFTFCPTLNLNQI